MGAGHNCGMVKDEAAEIISEEEFQTGNVLTVAGAHFAHDTFSAFLNTVLPLIRANLGLTYGATGNIVVFTQMPMIFSPLIGYMADRTNLKYVMVFAPALTITMMSIMGLATSYQLLVLVMLMTGIGIAAFHAPASGVVAQFSGNRVGRGMGYYMAGGELGRFFGPLLIVSVIGAVGFEGSWRLLFVGWVITAILFFRLKDVSIPPPKGGTDSLAAFWQKGGRFFGAMGVLSLARVLLLVAITTFLSLFLIDTKEYTAVTGGIALAILEGAGVIGALFMGNLSDRLGRVTLLLYLFILAPFLLIGLTFFPATGFITPILLLLGLIAVSPTPVLLALVQDQFPKNRALANGIFIMENFGARSVGIWLVGFLADRIGIEPAFYVSALVAFLAIPPLLYIAKISKPEVYI